MADEQPRPEDETTDSDSGFAEQMAEALEGESSSDEQTLSAGTEDGLEQAGAGAAAEQETPEPPWSVRGYLGQLAPGAFDAAQDDRQALDSVLGYFGNQNQILAQQLQEAQARLQQLEQSAGAAQPQVEAQADKPLFEPLPEYDEALARQYIDPETGKFIPGTPPEVIKQHYAYETAQRQRAQQLMSDPQGFFEPVLKTYAEKLRQEIREELTRDVEQQRSQQAESESFYRFVSENQDLMYQSDGQGNLLRDPLTRQLVPSPFGARLLQVAQELGQDGLRGERRMQHALRIVQGEVAEQQFQAQSATQTNDAKRQQLLDKNKPGSRPAPKTTPPGAKPGQSFDEQLRAELDQFSDDDLEKALLAGAFS